MNDEERAAQARADQLAGNRIQYSDDEGSGMHFAAVLHASCTGGTITREPDGTLSIQGANEAVLLTGMATGFRDYAVLPDLPLDTVLAAAAKPVKAAQAISYSQLRTAALLDHQSLFRRVRLDLGEERNSPTVPTDKRVTGMASNPDPSLLALYFNLGRYLLIASSRLGSQPANLQGISSAGPPILNNT